MTKPVFFLRNRCKSLTKALPHPPEAPPPPGNIKWHHPPATSHSPLPLLPPHRTSSTSSTASALHSSRTPSADTVTSLAWTLHGGASSGESEGYWFPSYASSSSRTKRC
ncbi:hypothetical protein R3P38DRAFT_3229834 [Favolaschia claudopus]|uniref:Uncharacterized protein n=1 Tax=Favolaschia claudopus TaxID=2862362 RepID=A0AAV9ZN77_9AGAR